MSIAWGTALDAEVAYRQQKIRDDYHRWNWRRKPAHKGAAQRVAAHDTAHHDPVQQIPAQRVPAPLIPARPRPVDRERTSAHAA